MPPKRSESLNRMTKAQLIARLQRLEHPEPAAKRPRKNHNQHADPILPTPVPEEESTEIQVPEVQVPGGKESVVSLVELAKLTKSLPSTLEDWAGIFSARSCLVKKSRPACVPQYARMIVPKSFRDINANRPFLHVPKPGKRADLLRTISDRGFGGWGAERRPGFAFLKLEKPFVLF